MQIQVWFTNDKYIDVRLFDNSVCAKWFNHYQPYSLEKYYGGGIIPNLFNTRPGESRVVKTQWDFILNAINELTKLGFAVPIQIPSECDYNQSTLNVLHRFFTYNAMWYWDSKSDSSILNPFDKNFKLPANMLYKEWLGIIDPINDAVHCLENFTSTDNKKLCATKMPISSLVINHTYRSPTDLTPWLEFNDEEQKYNYTYLNYDLPLVVLNNSILGKCVLQSFYEDDDLSARDCTGRLGSYGGFNIDLNNNRKKIYQSAEFNDWVKKHNKNRDTLPLDFPIGHVNNYEDTISWIHTPNLKFKKLIFINNDNK